MFCSFSGETANEVWMDAYKSVMLSNSVETRCGFTKEIIHATISINNPIQKWVTSKVPPISIGFALAELIWILKGSNDSKTINFWNPVLPKYSGAYETYPGAYGYRIMYQHGINQLENVYQTLKNNPNSRQSVILIWDPKTDLPINSGIPNNNDIPCNICSLIKIRNGKLEWSQVMRSNDLIKGLPYNLVQFTAIQEILASWLKVGVGTYNHLSDSLHIYENIEDKTGIQLCNEINTDSLGIKKEDFNRVVDLIYDIMVNISHSFYDENKLISMASQSTGYEAYDNILKVICAYAAYRLNLLPVQEQIINTCSNRVYKIMWTNWVTNKIRR